MKNVTKGILCAILSISLIVITTIILQSSVFAFNWDSATYSDPEGTTVTMSVYPMLSIHSDWHRKLKISDDRDSIKINLFEDTGWWRGSSLYKHTSGSYVLIEGQNGCITFTAKPLSFESNKQIPCHSNKEDKIIFHRGHGLPISRYYEDMIYLGTFYEQSSDDGASIRFYSYLEREERLLPDPL